MTTPLPTRRARNERPRDHDRRLRRLGRRRRRLGLRLGPAGRRRVGRRDPPRGGEGRQLDRHRGRLRLRPLRGGRGPRPRRDPRPPSGRSCSRSAACAGTTRTGWPRPSATPGPARVREECEASLRRLGVERIDLYQFHWPDETGTPVEDSWGEMLRLVDEGKVRWPGVSNFDVALLERCEAVGHVQSLQPPFSMIRRDVGGAEIPWCAAHGTGVIVYSPMQSGLLTDSFTAERVGGLPARRLAARVAPVPVAEPRAEPRAARRAAADRGEARRVGRGGGGGVDARLAGRHRRDRRRAQPASRWTAGSPRRRLRLDADDLAAIAAAIAQDRRRLGADGAGLAPPAGPQAEGCCVERPSVEGEVLALVPQGLAGPPAGVGGAVAEVESRLRGGPGGNG